MLLSKKIRLEVSEQDAATLEFIQGKCRGLYNWWVVRLRNGEKWPGWEEAKKTLQASKEHDPEFKWVYGKVNSTGSQHRTRTHQPSAGYRRATSTLVRR